MSNPLTKLQRWIDRQWKVCVTRCATVRSVGHTARFHIHSKAEYKVIVGGLSEAEIRDAVFAQIKPDDVVYEIGAHIGSWSVFLAQHVSRGALHVFEPVPGNAEKLGANLRLNELGHASVHPHAVGESQGELTMSVPDASAPVGSSLLNDQAGANAVTVQVKPLDALAASLGAPTVLKVDCEGAEAMVFRGGQGVLRDSVRVIFLELHPAILRDSGEDPAALIQSLEARGFSVTQRWPEQGEDRHLLLVRG